MKILFYGTPAFAVPTLEALLERHEVVAVVTQPDRPAGRGQRVTASAVKVRAEAADLPILQPARVRDPEWPERLGRLDADLAVVVAFGQILPKAVLDAPRRGSINVHASLLPRYRGAAPIAWAIIRGERETGITTFQMDPGMDTGEMLLREATPIGPGETAGDLAARLSRLGAEVLMRTLDRLDALTPQPQDAALATLAPRLRKEDGRLRLREAAPDLVNRVRGCNPWPGAALMTPAGRLLVWRATSLPAPGPPASGVPASARPDRTDAAPGTLVRTPSGEVGIATGSMLLLPIEVQPDNRRAMPWDAFLRGTRLGPGTRLTEIA